MFDPTPLRQDADSTLASAGTRIDEAPASPLLLRRANSRAEAVYDDRIRRERRTEHNCLVATVEARWLPGICRESTDTRADAVYRRRQTTSWKKRRSGSGCSCASSTSSASAMACTPSWLTSDSLVSQALSFGLLATAVGLLYHVILGECRTDGREEGVRHHRRRGRRRSVRLPGGGGQNAPASRGRASVRISRPIFKHLSHRTTTVFATRSPTRRRRAVARRMRVRQLPLSARESILESVSACLHRTLGG